MKDQNKLSKEQAVKIVASKGIISDAGVHRVKCTNVTPYHQDRGNGAIQVAIANFNAQTAYHRAAAKTLLMQGDYDDAANQGLSRGILQGQFVPMKGQIVDIVVEEITTNNGVTGLFVTGCSPAPVQAPTKTSADDLLREINGEAEGTEIVAEDLEEVEAPAFK